MGLQVCNPRQLARSDLVPRPRARNCSSKEPVTQGKCARQLIRASGTDQPPPPYSSLSSVVYSLATVGPDGQRADMNLVTYAAPISLSPRHYALGLYVGTLTWEHFLATRCGLLQILGEQHASLFDLLGKQSGRDVDKIAEMTKRGFKIGGWGVEAHLPCLEECYGAMELRMVSEPLRCGDHDVVTCLVEDYSAGANQGVQPLYTEYLRQQGLM